MNAIQSHIYTVTELTQNIKALLEDTFPILWISGEISNLSRPSSGHVYFTLKDDKAQIRAVMFKGQARNLTFRLEDGLTILGMGRIGVYPPQGHYQIIFEMIEPKGWGALQLAYEQLKAKLAQEGLFDVSHKRPLPFLPDRVCIITSASGAVIHDMIQIMGRRFPTVAIQVIPVRVQGKGAEQEIAAAIETANRMALADVLVVARGGGSLEDLQPFNTETLARAVFASRIPVVSAVGHETDYTIIDFVADKRAPTPSAAAEMIVPERDALAVALHRLDRRASAALQRNLLQLRNRWETLRNRLAFPIKRLLTDRLLLVDDLHARSNRAVHRLIAFSQERYTRYRKTLMAYHPGRYITILHAKLERLNKEKYTNLLKIIDDRRFSYRELQARLNTLSPLAILERGYSITQRISDQRIVTTTDMVQINDRLAVRLFQGSLICRIERKTHGQDDV